MKTPVRTADTISLTDQRMQSRAVLTYNVQAKVMIRLNLFSISGE
jgi:hypothetical protein